MYNEGKAVVSSKEKHKAGQYFQQGGLSPCTFFEYFMCFIYEIFP